MVSFTQMMAERELKTHGVLCVGLDPLPEKVPESIKGATMWARVATQMIEIVDATAEYANVFKPQKAHYEAIPEGQKALQMIVSHIHNKHLDIPVFLDCKRGDIDRTQQRYKIAHFEIDGVDGMNFNPYMGKDCMAQLVDKNYPGRAIVGLCYTSNPSAREIQDIMLADGQQLWEFIARTTQAWARDLDVINNAGLVMAAAYEKVKGSGEIFSQHLSRGREIVGDSMWYLVPGVGTQQGFVKETIKAGHFGIGTMVINSSSGITFASMGKDFAKAAANEAERLWKEMNECLKNMDA